MGLAAAPRLPGLAKALESASAASSVKGGGGGGDEEEGIGDKNGGIEKEENEKQREAGRAKKNVNRSLQRLKEQIKAEKLRKRLEVSENGVVLDKYIYEVHIFSERALEVSI